MPANSEQGKNLLDKMFKNLVESALDFLRRALREIEKEPKYSIIHFYAAIELILKARLMDEHWTLIVANREKLDWNKFTSGDFRSVSLYEADDRLRRVVRSGLSRPEFAVFKSVSKHRNRIVHFLNNADYDDVVKEVLNAWYYLDQLLTSRWDSTFADWRSPILEIDWEMNQLQSYLKVVYDKAYAKNKSWIDGLKKSGTLFTTCRTCEKPALTYDDSEKKCYDTECLVCEVFGRGINVSCDECGGTIVFQEDGDGRCVSESCGNILPREDLEGILSVVDLDPSDPDVHNYRGTCISCYMKTMVLSEHEEYVCTNCLLDFPLKSVETCGWCHEKSAGVNDVSAVFGCEICGGSNELHRD